MNVLPGPRTAMADDYFVETAEVMTRLFGISEDEAIGRIAQEFGHWNLGDDDRCWMLGHEDADYWAHWTYYGDVHWWLMAPDELTPLPYPAEA